VVEHLAAEPDMDVGTLEPKARWKRPATGCAPARCFRPKISEVLAAV
jgi:hypothetical protein